MALTSEQFRAELEDTVAQRRAFWDHPWIEKFRRAELSTAQVRHWIEQQFYVTGRVHDLFGPIYAKCDDDTIRAGIVENLIEEETGKISGSGPHPELYIRLGEALGSTRETMRGIKPLPEALSLRTYWVWAAKELPLIEGMAAISIAGEAQLPGAACKFARILEEKYGLTHEQSAFWWVHDEADKDHGGGAIRIVAQYARTDEEQRRVRDVVDNSLTLLWRFFDGLELAYGAHAQAA